MVDINCTYEYPDNVQYRPNTVRTLWFTKGDKYQPVDLEHDADYTGRVESSCEEGRCVQMSWNMYPENQRPETE
jgi:hypothetical protein